jgi:hypothetical protein
MSICWRARSICSSTTPRPRGVHRRRPGEADRHFGRCARPLAAARAHGREAGVEGLVLDSWMGLFAPAKTPSAVVERLRAATLKVIDLPDTRRRFQSGGWREISMSPEETAAFVQQRSQKWPAFLKQAGIHAQ